MAYTLQIYTHRSTGRDRQAAEKVAGLIFGEGWACGRCGTAYLGTQPGTGLCPGCDASEGYE